jgi:hypothetical protein
MTFTWLTGNALRIATGFVDFFQPTIYCTIGLPRPAPQDILPAPRAFHRRLPAGTDRASSGLSRDASPSPQINLNEMIGFSSLSEYMARAKYTGKQKSGRKLRDWFDHDRGTSWRKSNTVGLRSRFSHRPYLDKKWTEDRCSD